MKYLIILLIMYPFLVFTQEDVNQDSLIFNYYLLNEDEDIFNVHDSSIFNIFNGTEWYVVFEQNDSKDKQEIEIITFFEDSLTTKLFDGSVISLFVEYFYIYTQNNQLVEVDIEFDDSKLKIAYNIVYFDGDYVIVSKSVKKCFVYNQQTLILLKTDPSKQDIK